MAAASSFFLQWLAIPTSTRKSAPKPEPLRRWLLAAALVTAVHFPSVLPAQERLADAARQAYDSVLTEVRDSLNGVLAASWEFSRDLKQAGEETVLARAAALRARCSTAASTVQRTPARLGSYASQLKPATRTRLGVLTSATVTLREALRAECQAGFSDRGRGARADSLRAWGPYRVAQLEKAISAYEREANAFAELVGVRLEPK